MPAKQNLTDSQRILNVTMDAANELVIAYAAPEVPSLENKTPEGLLEDFGRLNEARKAIEKTEKIVRGRLEALLEGKTELRGDNYQYKRESSTRTALDQTAAKKELERQGILEDFMVSSEVERVTVKRL